MKKDVKLYSAFFPFYGILLLNFKDLPWMTAANVAILALVAFLVLQLRKTPELKKTFPKVLGLAWLGALLTDAVALFARFLPTLAEILLRFCGVDKAADYLAKYWPDFTWYEIWDWWNPVGLPWTIGSILVSGVAAYFLFDFVILKKAVPDRKTRRILAICLAVFSAPYSWTNPAW